mmetsp:Transcript_10993/g.23540  ORF Transcript_10993/g.23540 Transcript_10993/m.23540 type:complete len:147 (+) Transcript_10993:250-690(+)
MEDRINAGVVKTIVALACVAAICAANTAHDPYSNQLEESSGGTESNRREIYVAEPQQAPVPQRNDDVENEKAAVDRQVTPRPTIGGTLPTAPPVETAAPRPDERDESFSTGELAGLIIGTLVAMVAIFTMFGLSIRYRRVLDNLGM